MSYETKTTCRVDAIHTGCGGLFEATGEAFMTIPPQYGHVCLKCGFQLAIKGGLRYPRHIHPPVESLAPREMYYDQEAFVEGHKGCSELICRESDGMPIAAVYYFPPGTANIELRDFFRRVRVESEPGPLDGDEC